MAISKSPVAAADEAETEIESLLCTTTVDGYVDHRGQPSSRFESGCWRSASFIIGVEVAERCAFFGIYSNLITYLTGPLGQPTAAAAANVNAWAGASSLLPLAGAVVADSSLGRYRTVVFSTLVLILGLVLLTLSALQTSNSNGDCRSSSSNNGNRSCPPQILRVIFFYISVYLVAVGQAGVKPSVQAFGADQFDERNPNESRSKSSFFNWWYFFQATGVAVTLVVLIYIQDNINWALAFGILSALMVFVLVVFMLGTKTYRYSVQRSDQQNPFARIGRVFVLAFKNWGVPTPDLEMVCEEDALRFLPPQNPQQFKFLNKALVGRNDGSLKDGKASGVTMTDIEEAKALLRLVPIWTTLLVFGMVASQSSTFFTKQGATMDRTIFSGIQIPPASLQILTSFVIIFTIAIYDRVLIPIARTYSGIPSGITTLQRIGTGIVFSIILMALAGLVELKRLEMAKEYGLIDKPYKTIPMSIWWLVPQYVLLGIAEVFSLIGIQEFFYDQIPKELRSLGIGLYLSVLGVGNFLSSFLVSAIDEVTSANGGVSWFSTNLNEAHLDYFYWLLAALNALSFIAYLYFTKSYFYK